MEIIGNGRSIYKEFKAPSLSEEAGVTMNL